MGGAGSRMVAALTVQSDTHYRSWQKSPRSIEMVDNTTGREVRPTGRVTKFVSGDELDDDFMTGNMHSIPEDKSSDSKIDPSDSKDVHVKSKKKQGPRVVNFVG
ncbi:hypothetical protein NC652_030300 [Populus alba x Populus x berolinensis]|nr:hypothetical protein NC652_030300 [Populus alba x Populus x berolinensis]